MGDIRSITNSSIQTYTVSGDANQSLASPSTPSSQDDLYRRYLALCKVSPFVCFLTSCVGDKPSTSDTSYDSEGSDDSSTLDCNDPDGDGDGYNVTSCDGDDCDDDNNTINPDAEEIRSDGIDQNCNGMDDEDVDGDGVTVEEGDCDDNDATSFPGNTETQDNGVDNDCSGDLDGGGTVNCGGEFTTIQNAVNLSRDGDSIGICAGTYAESVNVEDIDLTLYKTGAGDVIVTGNGSERAFTFKNGIFKLKDISIFGSTTTSDGGGLLVKSGAELTITGTNISYNSAVDSGGGIAVGGGTLYVLGNNTISHNTAADGSRGAGIYTSGYVSIDPNGGNITMAGNEGTFAIVGGSMYIYTESGTLTLTDSYDFIWNAYLGSSSNLFIYGPTSDEELSLFMDGEDASSEFSLRATGFITITSSTESAWYDSSTTRAYCSWNEASCTIF